MISYRTLTHNLPRHFPPQMPSFPFPWRVDGKVVKGFGRGSKELGIPTANLDDSAISKLPDGEVGVYFGWASLSGKKYKMVVSIGWNPFFKNEKIHILKHKSCESSRGGGSICLRADSDCIYYLSKES